MCWLFEWIVAASNTGYSTTNAKGREAIVTDFYFSQSAGTCQQAGRCDASFRHANNANPATRLQYYLEVQYDADDAIRPSEIRIAHTRTCTT